MYVLAIYTVASYIYAIIIIKFQFLIPTMSQWQLDTYTCAVGWKFFGSILWVKYMKGTRYVHAHIRKQSGMWTHKPFKYMS